MRNEKAEKEFIEFYKGLYGDTSKETGTWKLPTISPEEEEEHKRMWKEELTKILGKKNANRVWKVRPYGPQTYLDYVFSWLWLGYWPTVLRSNNNGDGNK